METKTKFTPGPWIVRQPDSHMTPNNHFQIVANSPHAEGLAQIVCELNGPWSHPNYRANARLISKAPEMVEALKVCEKVFNVETIDPMKAFITIEKVRSLLNSIQSGGGK